MAFHWNPSEQVRTGRYLLKWGVLGSLVGGLAGTASAVFLLSLDAATEARVANPWLLYLLPVAGCLIGLLYHTWGADCEGGNNLILDEIHDPNKGVSSRLAPLILLATVGTHLFGGSAGREGTAVQMGGSLAAGLARKLGLDRIHTRILLMAGISAGFGAVFGTPLAGMIFGLEVLTVGRLRYDALVPCLIASVVGDWTCTAWGVHHTQYVVSAVPAFTALLVGKIILATMAFALVSILFSEITHGLQWAFAKLIPWAPGRPVVGGLIVIALVWLIGSEDYLGLGIPMILESFQPEGVPTWAFFWKVIFTAVTLGAGFKGGEVTPLFFIGAALGCTLGIVLGVPTDFLAALGFVAVFAGAANTPLACTVMGIELFGAVYAPSLAIACCLTYIWTGHRGIYLSQMVGTPKTDDPAQAVSGSLKDVRRHAPPFVLSLGLLAGLAQRWYPRRTSQPPVFKGDFAMDPERRLNGQTVGLMCIYFSSSERAPTERMLQRLFARPLYQEVIDRARAAGLWGASARSMAAGFAQYGKQPAPAEPEPGYPNTHIFVELIAPRAQLEAFHAEILPLIGERLITFAEVEQWGKDGRPVTTHAAL